MKFQPHCQGQVSSLTYGGKVVDALKAAYLTPPSTSALTHQSSGDVF